MITIKEYKGYEIKVDPDTGSFHAHDGQSIIASAASLKELESKVDKIRKKAFEKVDVFVTYPGRYQNDAFPFGTCTSIVDVGSGYRAGKEAWVVYGSEDKARERIAVSGVIRVCTESVELRRKCLVVRKQIQDLQGTLQDLREQMKPYSLAADTE